MRIRSYFSKPRGVREQKRFENSCGKYRGILCLIDEGLRQKWRTEERWYSSSLSPLALDCAECLARHLQGRSPIPIGEKAAATKINVLISNRNRTHKTGILFKKNKQKQIAY